MERPARRGLGALLAVALLTWPLALPRGGQAPQGTAAAGPPPFSSLPMLAHRPGRGDSVLVFAAHPDDEALGAGGLIHAALTAGAHITVVIFTNGDGYLEGVDVGFHTLFSTPDRFLAYGKQRQAEAVAAAARLGLPASQVVFLGYPDRGLAVLWGPRWNCDKPYTSPYTRADRSPYPGSYTPHALYCGRSVLADVMAVLRRERPTVVITHHPEDTHQDHWAAGAFVTFALESLAFQGDQWARAVSVDRFLVHHGAWPAPRIYAPDLDLRPPSDLWESPPAWVTVPLDQADQQAKRLAVLEYRSQAHLLRPYMLSFVRRNELFDTSPAVRALKMEGDAVSLGSPKAWDRLPEVLRAPASGSVLRAAEGSAIIDSVAVGQSAARLYIALRLRRALIRGVQYRVEMRLIYTDGRTARQFLHFEVSRRLSADRYDPDDLPLPDGAAARGVDRRILVALPLEGLGEPVSLYLRGLTVGPFRTVVDRTPWTLLHLAPVGAHRGRARNDAADIMKTRPALSEANRE